MLSPEELRVIVGRHELDLVYRPAGQPCQACVLFAAAGAATTAVAIDGHLYFPPVQQESSGRHAHPSLLPSPEHQTRADLAAVRALAAEVSKDDPAIRSALAPLGARLEQVDPADPLTDRAALAAAAALLLPRADRAPVGRH